MKMNGWDWVAWVLVVVGAINWGLVGVFKWDLVAAILGEATIWSRIIYDLVGVSGLYMLVRGLAGNGAES